ncbi:DUF2087 domain-containing protein [uncultured Piscinibacter sp.]|uniref:DUF2087 domain-containing protein n=1 Tax=uncultured Piscinibacter sp. TaxID=1131835 RepID=UPI00261E4B3A|nr:DUF2087 domain-containing protein [uncultured Piscinibacter sp.]
MTRTDVPLHAADISSFAKALGRDLKAAHERLQRPPGHVELLNMLARAAGHRNFQSLKAQPAAPLPESPEPAATLTDTAAKALRQFDAHGRLVRWPIRFSVQRLMLWGLWMRFDGKRRYSEREVNELLKAWHLFGDHCTLRRELVAMKLLARTDGGAEYRKLPRRPDAEAVALMRALRGRGAG